MPGVPELHLQHVAGGNFSGFRRTVQHIAAYGFRFAHRDRHAGFEIFHADFARFIRVIRSVSNFRAASVRNLKLDVGKRSVIRSLNEFADYKRGRCIMSWGKESP